MHVGGLRRYLVSDRSSRQRWSALSVTRPSSATGRQFAAWLGLTPTQRSSEGKNLLGGITKRGDSYLRTLLVQGARAVMHFVHRRDDRHSRWIQAVMHRRHPSVAAIALANKTARIAWVILTSDAAFKAA
jgi:transposase